MLTVGHSRKLVTVFRKLGLTELVCEVIMAFKNFDQVVEHSKIDGYFRNDFFHKIRLFFNAQLNACRISIGKGPGAKSSQIKEPIPRKYSPNQRKSCFELAIFIASTMLLKPFASRTILLFSKIQCNWCSGDVVSAKVPNTCECRFVPAVNAQSPTLQYVQQSARVCEPDLDVLVF